MAWLVAPSSKHYLASFVKHINPPDDACPISYDYFSADIRDVIQARCSKHHVFHKDCLREWFTGSNTWPMCRTVCFFSPAHEAFATPLPTLQRTYGLTASGYDTDLDGWEQDHADDIYSRYVAHLWSILGPIMEQDEMLAQFNIDLEDQSQGVRFQRALAAIISTGVSLCRFPGNVHATLSAHFERWDSVAFLIATWFVHIYWPLMTPQQWCNILAVRNVIYQKALVSDDFGADTKTWLDHIAAQADPCYELFSTAEGWPADTLSEMHWMEVDSADNPITEPNWMYLVPGQVRSHHDFVEFASGGDEPIISYDGAHVWVSEPYVGALAALVVNEETRTAKLTNAAGRAMLVRFCAARPV
jgi:hypothetical protein